MEFPPRWKVLLTRQAYCFSLLSGYTHVVVSQNTKDLACERLLHHNQTSKFFFDFLKFLKEGPTYFLGLLITKSLFAFEQTALLQNSISLS